MSNQLIGYYGNDGMRTINGQEWCEKRKRFFIAFGIVSFVFFALILGGAALDMGTQGLIKKVFGKPFIYIAFFIDCACLYHFLKRSKELKPILGDYFGYRADVKRLASILERSVKKITECSRAELGIEIRYRKCKLLNKIKGQVRPGPICPKARGYWRQYKDLHILAQKFGFDGGKFPNPTFERTLIDFINWCHIHPNDPANKYWEESDKPTEIV